MRIVLGITGASGVTYAVRLLEVLTSAGCEVHLSISEGGRAVLAEELGLNVHLDGFRPETLISQAVPGTIRYWHFNDWTAAIASGSFLTDGMVVCPCSGGTLSAIVRATNANLIHRAAEVHLKEHRKLIVVPRETPLSLVQLDNLRRAAEAGAIVLPAMPGFYHRVSKVQDLVDFIVARICDQLGIEHNLIRRWGSE